MRTLKQQRDTTGLASRLRQILGPIDTVQRPSVGPPSLTAEDLPGLYFQVALNGAILGLSSDLAETLGAPDPAILKGLPIATYLPAVASGTPLLKQILEQGQIQETPVRLLCPMDGVWITALLSTRSHAANGIARGAWMGCLTLSSPDDRRSGQSAGVDRELMDGIRVELRTQLELLALQFPQGSGGDAPASARGLLRMCLVILPRLEAVLALDTPPCLQFFDARAAIADLCRTSGRLLDGTGVSLIFDLDPAFPALVSSDVNRLRTCLSLLLGAVSATEEAAEIVVRLAFEAPDFLKLEVAISPAPGRTALGTQPNGEIELSHTLAATVNGVVSRGQSSPDCAKYELRLRASGASESDAAAIAIDRALQGVRILFVGPGANQTTIFAKWMERQHAGFLYASAAWEIQSACSGVRPDIAVVDLSVCQRLPEFLNEVPVLGLRGSLAPLPEWCGTCIEKPVFEQDLLDGICSLRPRVDPERWEPQGTAASTATRILAVEDNPVNQRIIQQMLLKLGYEVDLASNGLEALVAVRRCPHDLILMDWEMPVMDGLEATAAIRGLPEPLCRIPIIALTAHALQGDREVCLKAGMDDYMSKPLNVDRLRGALKKWLPRSPRLLRQE